MNAEQAIHTLESVNRSLEARIAGLEAGLKNLTRDCMASDFNEHWDSFKAAESLLKP